MLNTNINQSAQPSFMLPLKQKPFLGLFLLLLITSVVFLVIVFLLGLQGQGGKSALQGQIDVLASNLKQSEKDPNFVTTYTNALSKVLQEPGAKAQYKQVFNIAQGAYAFYSANHNPKLREFIATLSAFAQKNYPSYFKAPDFYVLCVDTECAKVVNKPEIVAMRDHAQRTDLGLNKEGILNAFYDATLVSNGTTLAEKGREFNSLSYVLTILRLEVAHGNIAAQGLEDKVLTYLIKNYPDAAKQLQATDSASLDKLPAGAETLDGGKK